VDLLISVLVADNNVELCTLIEEFFAYQTDLELVGVAYDGEEALEKIDGLQPDVVVLDITMPQLDGIGVMEELNRRGESRPKVIVLTAFAKDSMVQRMTQLGADYFVVKPFDLNVLVERIRQFGDSDSFSAGETAGPYRPVRKHDPLVAVSELLQQMGIPAHFKGYTYLRDAVLMVFEEERFLGGLTKELYPRLAEKYDSSPSGVEAAIRNAIMAAWKRGNRQLLKVLTGQEHIDQDEVRFPTNSMVIAKLVDRLRLRTEAG